MPAKPARTHTPPHLYTPPLPFLSLLLPSLGTQENSPSPPLLSLSLVFGLFVLSSEIWSVELVEWSERRGAEERQARIEGFGWIGFWDRGFVKLDGECVWEWEGRRGVKRRKRQARSFPCKTINTTMSSELDSSGMKEAQKKKFRIKNSESQKSRRFQSFFSFLVLDRVFFPVLLFRFFSLWLAEFTTPSSHPLPPPFFCSLCLATCAIFSNYVCDILTSKILPARTCIWQLKSHCYGITEFQNERRRKERRRKREKI